MSSAIALVFDPQGNVLALRRGLTDPWMPHRWNFPGGRVEVGETPVQGVLRELHEEAGIRLPPRELRWAFSYCRQGMKVTHVFWAKLRRRPRVVSRDGEHDAATWCKLTAIPQPSIPPVRDVVERVTGRSWNLAPLDTSVFTT